MARWRIPLPEREDLGRLTVVGSSLTVVGTASAIAGLLLGGAPVQVAWLGLAAVPSLIYAASRALAALAERTTDTLSSGSPVDRRSGRRSSQPSPTSSPPLSDRLGVLRDHPARHRAAWAESWSAHGVQLELPRAGGPRAWLPGYGTVVVEISAHRLRIDATRFEVAEVRRVALQAGAIVVELRDGTRWQGPAVTPPDPARLRELLGAVATECGSDEDDRARVHASLSPLVDKAPARR